MWNKKVWNCPNDIIYITTLVNNGNEDTGESYTNKHQNHVGCSFGYRLYVPMINLARRLSHI